MTSQPETNHSPVTLRSRLDEFRRKHEQKMEIGFFIGGFILDVILLSAPDEPLAIVQQVVFLVLIAALLHFEILFRMQKWRPGNFLVKLWPYRTFLLHFLLGGLLNVYSLFYIKSASLMSSLIFLVLMLGLIVANELPFLKKANVAMKMSLYAICLISFTSIIFPIIFGFVGWIPFIFAVVTTGALFALQFKWLRKQIPDDKILLRSVVIPGGSVIGALVLFYFLALIPPVPLSAKEMGIYHNVERRDGKYLLYNEKPWWKFWQTGDSDFKAQPGDKIYFYTQVYSPARIDDELDIHWLLKNRLGDWELQDRIPLKIVGGREEGFRGFAFKSNYTPGDWKIELNTKAGLEISRIYFPVTAVEQNLLRQFKFDER